jgi:hypothetical protein
MIDHLGSNHHSIYGGTIRLYNLASYNSRRIALGLYDLGYLASCELGG